MTPFTAPDGDPQQDLTMGCKNVKSPKIVIFWCKIVFLGFQNAFFGFPDPKNGGYGHIFGL